jgi:hypothetical protein
MAVKLINWFSFSFQGPNPFLRLLDKIIDLKGLGALIVEKRDILMETG